jgi:uncharacterized protein YndB with AHSA1/START domain
MGTISSEAVKAKTGKDWDEWFSVLDKAGANKWAHKEIAIWLREKQGVGDWWCQMVTVEYERARGLRVVHQTATGYSASVSRTVAAPLASVYPMWSDARRRKRWLGGELTIRRATENQSMRITWGDGSHVDVGFYPKGEGKTQVTVEQSKLPDAKAVAAQKEFWAAALERMKGALG